MKDLMVRRVASALVGVVVVAVAAQAAQAASPAATPTHETAPSDTCTVWDVVGTDPIYAQGILRLAGFSTRFRDSGPIVVATVPSAGTAPCGELVNIYLGHPRCTVPSIIGFTPQAAESLYGHQFKFVVNNPGEGSEIRLTEPRAGTVVNCNTTVRLTVGRRCNVPLLLDMSRLQAEVTLNAWDLVPDPAGDVAAKNSYVIAQNPSWNDIVWCGSEVTIHLREMQPQ
jgi:beta-lactam-binding protein with PASTA domain